MADDCQSTRNFFVHSENLLIRGNYPEVIVVHASSSQELLEKICHAYGIMYPPWPIEYKNKLHIWSARTGVIGRKNITNIHEIPAEITDIWLRIDNF